MLAGTMLMGSGISGNRPDAHDSTVTLATLVREDRRLSRRFLADLLHKLSGAARRAAAAEATALRQPFGGARQHFNHYLSRQRARQLQHVHVAQLFAAMGYAEGAQRQMAVVPVASARMTCEMRCRLAAAHMAIERGNLAEAAAQLPPVEDLLHAAIECGAMVDPWNILGFGGQFSLFPAMENSVHDHRVDELVGHGGRHLRAVRADSQGGRGHRRRRPARAASRESGRAGRLVGQVRHGRGRFGGRHLRPGHAGIGPRRGRRAAGVARRGAAAGDLAFWRRHIEPFRSPKAYALVVETLLDHRDPVAAMALLVQWLGQADEIPLVEEDYSFHDLALLWMEDLWENAAHPRAGRFRRPVAERRLPPRRQSDLRWRGSFSTIWKPTPRNTGRCRASRWRPRPWASEEPTDEDEDDGDEDNIFGAAYEQVTYRDSADDGIEGEMFETGQSPTDFELVGEAERIVDRLSFLATVAQLWRLCAVASVPVEIARPRRGAGRLAGPSRGEPPASCWICWGPCTGTAFRRRAEPTSRWWSTTAGGASRRRCWTKSSRPAWRRATLRG